MQSESRRGLRGAAMLLSVVLAGGLLVLAGCRASGPPRPPGRLPAVNTVLADDLPYNGRVADGDTTVVALSRGREDFWKATRGDWEYVWMVVRLDVVTVERGSWADPELSFICWGCAPTPESGIMLSVAPFLYHKGVTLAFDLDTTQRPARVVGQKVRHDPRADPPTQPAGR